MKRIYLYQFELFYISTFFAACFNESVTNELLHNGIRRFFTPTFNHLQEYLSVVPWGGVLFSKFRVKVVVVHEINGSMSHKDYHSYLYSNQYVYLFHY